MIDTKNKIIIGLAGALLALSSWLIGFVTPQNSEDTAKLSGYIRDDLKTNLVGTFRTYDFFASSTPGAIPTTLSTTTDATSTKIPAFTDVNGRIDNGYFIVKGAKRVEVDFTRGGETGNNTGTSTFTIEVSPNGSDWFSFNRLRQATSTTEQSQVGIYAWDNVNKVFATTTLRFGLNLDYMSVYAIRCIVVEEVDGNHTCKGYAEW